MTEEAVAKGTSAEDSELLACTCAHLADERKAEQIVVLNVGQLTFFTDYFVIATGRNERQIKAIGDEIHLRMTALGRPVIGIEGQPASGWVLIDVGDVVVHLFNPDTRRIYDLELLWGEAPRTQWQTVQPLTARAGAEPSA